jgi:type II restriction/modification system DNA methylase subunit YeeA
MTPQDFIRKWKPVALTERATAQEHFLDLCRLLEHPTPAEDDPTGERFTFEKGVPKTGGGDGFADVWKKGFFAWEYKKKKRDLDKAFEQLTRYAAALENPPLHVACDTHLFRVETRWTNEVPAKYEFELDDLAEPENLATLHAVFFDPEKLRSGRTRAKLTKEAADKFQTISDSLQHRNPNREAVAHFVNQLVFCFFADSVGLLPHGVWRKLLEACSRKPEKSKPWLEQLFADMKDGGDFNLEDIAQFNGGLFDGREPLRLEHTEIGLLFAAASLDWSLIDPTIFGTLFERFLDPDKRAQIGAHYTDPDKIMMIVEPVVARPLRREWETAKAEIEAIMAPALAASGGVGKAASETREKKFLAARAKAEAKRDEFIDRLCALRILDPACGSGNFLYLALQAVKDIEYRAILECETLGLGMIVPRVGPEILHGVEINPFAAELARTTIWIGDIQWRVKNAITHHPRPILRKLDSIECRDALLTSDGEGRSGEGDSPPSVMAGLDLAIHAPGTLGPACRAGSSPAMTAKSAKTESPSGFVEAEWPEADFIIGNPPFLGGKLLRRGLGDENVEALFRVYEGRVPAEADLVCYWFAKAWEAMQTGRAKRVGLVSTNSIRGGANRKVLEPIAEAGAIFEAWSDEGWTVDGAAVRVSLVCFGTAEGGVRLDAAPVDRIHADLSAETSNLPTAQRLPENAHVAFMGDTKGGAFDVDGSLARAWLAEPLNANGRSNSDVLTPWINGLDLTRRGRDMWIVDFGWTMSEGEAALYEAPFSHALEKVKAERDGNRRATYRDHWWRHVEPRPALRAALASLVDRHGRARPGHPRLADARQGVDARHKAGHDGMSECARYICTPRVAKHRLFVWLSTDVCPDSATIAIARDDDTTFGILHSRFHEAWSLRLGTWLGVGNDPRYTPTTTFETFPFPEGLTPNIAAADYAADPRAIRIAAAAKKLDDLRRAWLNPPDLVEIVAEVTPTAPPGEAPRCYPDRILPRTVEAAVKLKERTLTNLYNQRPRWLADAHDALDRAVAAAYGWPEDISMDDALQRLLALNLERAAA